MDKIWDRNPSKSEVIGRCGGDEKTEWPRRTDKSQTLKKSTNSWRFILIFSWIKVFEIDICWHCVFLQSRKINEYECLTNIFNSAVHVLIMLYVHLYFAILLAIVYKNRAFKKKTFEK